MDNTAKRLEQVRQKTVETVPGAWRTRNTPLSTSSAARGHSCPQQLTIDRSARFAASLGRSTLLRTGMSARRAKHIRRLNPGVKENLFRLAVRPCSYLWLLPLFFL